MTNSLNDEWLRERGKLGWDTSHVFCTENKFDLQVQFSYLNTGMGNAWASQRKPKPTPASTANELDFDVFGTFGAALPTGSACNKMPTFIFQIKYLRGRYRMRK